MILFSAGKSTVLNALLGDRFSEVALKRTTAGVNFFRIVQPKEIVKAENSKISSMEEGWSTFADDRVPQGAEDVHQEISKDNEELRSCETVGQKTFDVQVSLQLLVLKQ